MTIPGVPARLLRAPEAAPTALAHGRWSAELRGGEIDDIVFDGRLVLRSIRFVVRDHDWRTVASRAHSLSSSADGDRVVVTGEAADDAIAVGWTLAIGLDDDALTVELDAECRTDFSSNRMGLIVLHPPSSSGAALTVTHPGGGVTETVFPVDIAPHQPAHDIAGLAWVADGIACDLRLDGDVFEMEDQRNWTDASFKTYSTPLSRPFPVRNRAGDRVRQSLRLECRGGGAARADAADDVVRLALDAAAGVFPAIATSASSAPDAPHRSAPVDTLLLEVDVRWPNWRAALVRSLADAAGRRLDVRIVAALPYDVAAVLGAIDEATLSAVVRLGVFDATTSIGEPPLLAALDTALAARGAAVPLVAGTRAHFTELNRQHPRLDAWTGALTFSITPTMHDLGGHQVVESIGMQREVARNAARIARGCPVHIGPVTLRARFNAVATSPQEYPRHSTTEHGFGTQHVPGADDPRQASDALAAWVVGSVAALSAHGAESLTYFEEWGPRGMLAGDTLSPAGVVLGWAAEFTGAPRVDVRPSAPHVHAVATVDGGVLVALVGNLGALAAEVDLSAFGPEPTVERVGAAGERATYVSLAPGEAVRVRGVVDIER